MGNEFVMKNPEYEKKEKSIEKMVEKIKINYAIMLLLKFGVQEKN